MSGKGNPNYKGRTCDTDGYLLSKNRKLKIHREVCKEILGYEILPEGSQVHHRD